MRNTNVSKPTHFETNHLNLNINCSIANMKRFLFTLVFIISCVSIGAACECNINSNEEIFRQAKAIYVGKLVLIGTEKIQKEGYSPLHTLTFEIGKKWKGARNQKTTLLTNYSNMCSAFEFREGEEYLLYVQKKSYVTSECASSVKLSSKEAQARIKDLSSFWFRLKSRLWIF